MKTIETSQPIYQEAELTTAINGKPFIITGDPETVTELYKAAEADFSAQTIKDTPKLGKRIVEAVQASDAVLEGRRASIAAKVYDMVNGSSMYDLLQQKRRDERDLLMAKRLGLITTDRCAKHEKALASVRGMR
jgi:hypothetical protein